MQSQQLLPACSQTFKTGESGGRKEKTNSQLLEEIMETSAILKNKEIRIILRHKK